MPIRPENRSRYPADWREIVWAIRVVRAGDRCECDGRCGSGCCTVYGLGHSPLPRCNVRNGEPSRISGKPVVLTVAHLDHTPEHCNPANLLAMCQRCHLAYDRDHHAETARATRAAELAAQMDPLFDIQEVAAR